VKRQPFLHAGAVLLLIALYHLRFGSGTEQLAAWWFDVDRPEPDQVKVMGITVAAIIGTVFLIVGLAARVADRRNINRFVATKASAPRLLDETKVSHLVGSKEERQ
jgi:hypothetical protein